MRRCQKRFLYGVERGDRRRVVRVRLLYRPRGPAGPPERRLPDQRVVLFASLELHIRKHCDDRLQFSLQRRDLGFDVALQSFGQRTKDIRSNNAAFVHRRQHVAVEGFDDGDVLRFGAAAYLLDGLLAVIAHLLLEEIEADAMLVALDVTVECGAGPVEGFAHLAHEARFLSGRKGERPRPRRSMLFDDVNPVGRWLARGFRGKRYGEFETSRSRFAENEKMLAGLRRKRGPNFRDGALLPENVLLLGRLDGGG